MTKHPIMTKAQGFCNTRGKLFPTSDGKWQLVEIMSFTTQLFNPRNLEEVERFEKAEVEVERKLYNKNDGNDISKRRAIRRVFDLTMCNLDLNMFVTFTANKEEVDRYSYKAIIDYLADWLDNRVRRKGLKYILIPERHKDGAIHLHGFMNREALNLVDSGHKTGGKVVWNVADMTMGFSTAIQISGVREHVAKYIVKYIVKATADDKIGGRYILSGGKLIKPQYVYSTWDYLEIPAENEIEVCEGIRCKIVTGDLLFRIVNSNVNIGGEAD